MKLLRELIRLNEGRRQPVLEAKHQERVGLEAAEALLRAHCKKALKHPDTPLIRGIKGAAGDALLLQGELGARESRNSSNHYTVILDAVLPALGYPKRSASIILGNDANREYVSQYGAPFAVFPYDEVKIGVCPGDDVWETRCAIGPSRPKSFEKWNQLFYEWDLPEYSFEDLVAGIEETLADPEDEHFGLVSDVFSPGRAREQLEEAYSPAETGMQLATPATVYGLKGARELWIGGRCVAIRLSAWDEMRERLG